VVSYHSLSGVDGENHVRAVNSIFHILPAISKLLTHLVCIRWLYLSSVVFDDMQSTGLS